MSARRLIGLSLFALEHRASAFTRALRQWTLGGIATLDPSAVIYPSARVEPLAGDATSITVGANTHVRGQLLTAAHGGSIVLGDWSYVGEGTRIWSAASIVMGDRVLVSHGCDIHDWDAHPLDASARHAQFRHIVERGHPRHDFGSRSAPIRIGADVWIGFGATICKGVTVGAGSVVAARSLVLEDVPPGVLVGGVPARLIRLL